MWVPKFWGEDVRKIYSENGNVIFKETDDATPTTVQSIFILIYFAIFTAVGYYFGKKWFDNNEQIAMFEASEKILDSCQI